MLVARLLFHLFVKYRRQDNNVTAFRENLDPLSEHEDQELWSALEVAQIKNVIASHPEGLGK